MPKSNWKAPVFLDLDTLETPDKDEWSAVTQTTFEVEKPHEPAVYQKPVMLDMADTSVEPVVTVPHAKTQGAKTPLDALDAEYLAADHVDIPGPAPSSIPDWLWPVLGGTIALAVVLEISFFLITAFSTNLILGIAYLLLIGAVITAVGYAIRHYYEDVRQLSSVTTLRSQGEALFKKNEFGQSHFYLGEMTSLYQDRADMVPRLERYVAKKTDAHSDRDAMLLFSDTVMKPLDKKAYEVTVQRSKETALMIVLSPFAFLDVILTLWRNVRLIRDIASLYGARPGFLSSLSLMKKVLQSLAYAEVTELVADSAAETLGGSIVASLSTHVATGIGGGIMTARVGIHAMQICRPLPYVQSDKPSLKGVRREILKSIKLVFDKEPKEKFTERHI